MDRRSDASGEGTGLLREEEEEERDCCGCILPPERQRYADPEELCDCSLYECRCGSSNKEDLCECIKLAHELSWSQVRYDATVSPLTHTAV